jgi:energy-coupling factor transport system permease protein
LFTGNPVTLESVIYGMAAAGIICAVLLWFSSFNVIMTEDKLLAVVGTIMPHVAMLLAMVFRFVPKLVRQGKSVADANKALGMKTKGLKNKIKTQMDIFSITATWALENSVDTADSMKARGYGAGKRTSYNNYKIEMRDVAVILWIVILSATVCIGIGKGAATTYYYPVIQIKNNILVYISYTALCITPILIDIREAVRWHRLRLKI